MSIQSSKHKHTIYNLQKNNINAVVANGIWRCDQLLAEIAACRAPHLHILCIAVPNAAADEIARDARVYAMVDHCASLFLYTARRYSKSKAFGSKLEWVDIIVVDNWSFWNMSATWNKQLIWVYDIL